MSQNVTLNSQFATSGPLYVVNGFVSEYFENGMFF
jgi:hypothetical protein